MSLNLSIPKADGTSLNLTINTGECLFVLGANGTGKSAIMHRFYNENSDNARRITAHRQTWFASNTIALTPQQRREYENNMKGSDHNLEARWKEEYSTQRTNMAIYDLIDAENVRARGIARAVDDNNIELAKALSQRDAPIKIINELLRLSNIPIEIFVGQNDEILASKSGSARYGIAELSDGERNAMLIASNVLTVGPGTLILIDEPERHLHRSIISPLLTLLFARRPDCAFVVSTHDVMIPLDNPGARTLLMRNCAFDGRSPTAWDVDLVSSETEVNDDLKKDILGARRKLLFIEGTEQSLDKPLYSLIFPDVTVVPKSSSRNVEHAVSSIRDSNSLHWLHAFGIVDNDGRSQADMDRLRSRGVYPLSVFAVESIYYHPDVQRRVVERHAAVTGEDATTRLNDAKRAAIAAARPHIQRLSERVIEKTLREETLRKLPRRKDIAAARPIDITIDVPAIVAAECARLQEALDNDNLSDLITRYPVRETSALTEIAAKLGFQDREQYEGAVRKLFMDDNEVLEFAKSLFGTLRDDIDAT